MPSYRGTLELKKSGEKIRVINELLLEQYLRISVGSRSK